MLIDTHCHLDVAEFGGNQDAIIRKAHELGVGKIVIPSVEKGNFATVAEMAQNHPNTFYALGIHPLYVNASSEDDLAALDEAIAAGLKGSRLVAIGEIGLDFYIPDMSTRNMRERQEFFFVEQLKLARKYDLPVLLHTRRAVDDVLKLLRRHRIGRGIAHAFGGSLQQAKAFVDLGFMISFCGTITYERARQKQSLLASLPMDCYVIETDAPDLPPAWKGKKENTPLELPAIAQHMANLLGVSRETLAQKTSANAMRVLPRLASTNENQCLNSKS